jgi:hypothetical protein
MILIAEIEALHELEKQNPRVLTDYEIYKSLRSTMEHMETDPNFYQYEDINDLVDSICYDDNGWTHSMVRPIFDEYFTVRFAALMDRLYPYRY